MTNIIDELDDALAEARGATQCSVRLATSTTAPAIVGEWINKELSAGTSPAFVAYALLQMAGIAIMEVMTKHVPETDHAEFQGALLKIFRISLAEGLRDHKAMRGRPA